MGVVLTAAERARFHHLGTRCVAVGRSREVPLLEVLNNGKYYYYTLCVKLTDIHTYQAQFIYLYIKLSVQTILFLRMARQSCGPNIQFLSTFLRSRAADSSSSSSSRGDIKEKQIHTFRRKDQARKYIHKTLIV